MVIRSNLAFVWRLLRRLGLPAADAEDASQLVFMVLAKRLAGLPEGKERAFLYGTALRIAYRSRRTVERRREELCSRVEPSGTAAVLPDQLLVEQEAREQLSAILNALPRELGPVFVLYELEELSLSEISSVLAIPRGTVASRLRRGREVFQQRLQKCARGCFATAAEDPEFDPLPPVDFR